MPKASKILEFENCLVSSIIKKKCHHYALMVHLCLDIDEIPPGHIYPLSSVDLLSFHVVHLITYSKSQMLITTLQV